MADLQGLFRDAWRELETSVDDAVRRTAGRFGFPSQDEMAALARRVDAVSARLDALEGGKEKRAE